MMFRIERSIVKGMLVAVLALALVGAFAGQAAAQTQTDIDMLKGKAGQEFEVTWMSMMIQHHEGAVDMAEMAATRAVHQEVKDVAQNIIRDQTKEIADLTNWLQQWYNATPQAGMMHEDMGMAGMLQNATGDEFDKLFLQLMHEHHRGAIAMAELVPDRATHEELKALARNIITTQEAEIQQFMAWAQAWYSLDLMMPVPTPMPTTGDMGSTMQEPVGMPRTGGGETAFPLVVLLAGIAALTIAGGMWVRRRA
jgi:uncharacterized protein (DUF305 family)